MKYIAITNKQYKVTLITNVGFTLISTVSFLSVLFILWQIGGDIFDAGDISSIFLGFVAVLLTLFFVNLDRARKIKAEYSAAHELGIILRNMAISLRDIIDQVKEKPDEVTKINNTSERSIHHMRYLHYQDRLMSSINTLGIYDKIPEESLLHLYNAHIWYSNERSPSNTTESVYKAALVILIISGLDWYKRYDAWGFRNMAKYIIKDHVYGGKSYNELMHSAKQSMYGNDANRATPI